MFIVVDWQLLSHIALIIHQQKMKIFKNVTNNHQFAKIIVTITSIRNTLKSINQNKLISVTQYTQNMVQEININLLLFLAYEFLKMWNYVAHTNAHVCLHIQAISRFHLN